MATRFIEGVDPTSDLTISQAVEAMADMVGPHQVPLTFDQDTGLLHYWDKVNDALRSLVNTNQAQTLTGKTADDLALTGNPTFAATPATETDNFDATLTVVAASSGTRRLIHGSITLTPTTTFSVSGSGSLAATRGLITVSSGKTFVDGFLYGAEGRVILDGTIAESSAGRITGVLGKVALNGTLTAGQVSAVWGDLTGNPTLTVNDQLYVGRFTNSMSAGKKAQAFHLFYGVADFLFEASADGGTADWVVEAAVGGSQSHKLKINVMGTTFYIPLHTA